MTGTFEALTLEIFEAGLNWTLIFNKREAFRSAFEGFAVSAIADTAMTTWNGSWIILTSFETDERSWPPSIMLRDFGSFNPITNPSKVGSTVLKVTKRP